MDFCKIKKGELDVFDGSPPCQGFSTAGKRNVSDSRNDLFKEYARLLKELQPKVFVMENVSGMIKGKMKGRFLEILAELKQCGYNVKCKLMNAMWYDVPQSRERIIFLGIRNDLNVEIVYPKPNKEFISIKKAFLAIEEKIEKRTLGELGLIIWNKCKNGETFDKYHPKKHWFNAIKVNPNKPVNTMGKTVMPIGASGMFHWKYPRILSITEIKVLSSFPCGFQFIGKFQEQWARIGNSVPPKMMQAIAETIKNKILSRIN